MKEKPVRSLSGLPFLLAVLALLAVAAWLFFSGVERGNVNPLLIVGGLLLGLAALFSLTGLYTVQPNQAAVLSLFGKYVGTVKDNGLRWNNPFFSKKKVSQRVRNFESGKLKVNELDGSPIEIALVDDDVLEARPVAHGGGQEGPTVGGEIGGGGKQHLHLLDSQQR